MEAKAILDLKMNDNDADADTVRDYLKALVREVWVEEEGFSGKRPFGNSGWRWELLDTLTEHGVIKEDEGDKGLKLIRQAIEEL
jgi:hypothetical protein